MIMNIETLTTNPNIIVTDDTRDEISILIEYGVLTSGKDIDNDVLEAVISLRENN